MVQQRFTIIHTRATILSLPVLVLLVAATTVVAAIPKGTFVNLARTQSQPQRSQDRRGYHLLPVEPTQFASGDVVAQAAIYTPAPYGSAPSMRVQPPRRHIARGAARGAALGAVGGAITGDPGKGAAAGAAMGGTAGAFRRRDERMQQYPPPR